MSAIMVVVETNIIIMVVVETNRTISATDDFIHEELGAITTLSPPCGGSLPM
jgi:hypothetical protein